MLKQLLRTGKERIFPGAKAPGKSNLRCRRGLLTAMASISHRAPLGRSFTATQERAAGGEVLGVHLVEAAKSAISARKQVVLTTLSKEPAASRMAPTFSSIGLGGDASGMVPSAGFTGSWPRMEGRWSRRPGSRADGAGAFFGVDT